MNTTIEMKKEKRKAKAYIALKKESNVARELELWELQGAKNGDMFFPPLTRLDSSLPPTRS